MKHVLRIAALACLCPLAGLAQDAGDGGVRFTFGLSQRVDTSSDRDLTAEGAQPGADATTRLTFGAITQTRSERVALDLGTGLTLSDGGVTRGDSSATLAYRRSSADAVLELSAGWVQSDIAYRDASDFITADGALVLPEPAKSMKTLNVLQKTAPYRW